MKVKTLLRALLLSALCVLGGFFGDVSGASEIAPSSPSAADRWNELLQRSPFPYKKALPAPEPSPLDGLYVKFDPMESPAVHCRRCPDYAPAGGIWKMQLAEGVLRIIHWVSGWRSMTSFRADGGRLELFNDPHCSDVVGLYRWEKSESRLVLKALDDPCAIGLRAQNLTKQPWVSCQSPDSETAVTGHRSLPPGCQ